MPSLLMLDGKVRPSGKEALRLVDSPEAHIDLLVTDVVMPARKLAGKIAYRHPDVPVHSVRTPGVSRLIRRQLRNSSTHSETQTVSVSPTTGHNSQGTRPFHGPRATNSKFSKHPPAISTASGCRERG